MIGVPKADKTVMRQVDPNNAETVFDDHLYGGQPCLEIGIGVKMLEVVFSN